MELGQYVNDLQRQLVDAAENGSEDTRAAAERLAAGLDAATRLVLLDDASTSRTTLRLPDALKTRVDEAAAADGLSVNTWLVRAVAAALQPKQRRSEQRTLRTGDNFAGWAR